MEGNMNMKLKAMLGLFLCLFSLIALVPASGAQDLSKYRNFSLGTNLDTVLKLTDQKVADVNKTHAASSVFQELTWWPPSVPGGTYRSDSVEQILFSFYNGELYKISVTYDQNSTEGLTTEDMVKSISEKYGTPATVYPEAPADAKNHYEARERSVSTWEDSQHSLNLVRSSFSGRFGLILCTKKINTDAELAAAEAIKLETQEGPQREAQRQKKESDDLESARQKNRKLFRP
jgi:hypothetical protein